MPSDRVVINASPLICLAKSRQLELLRLLFSEIIVPAAVCDEVLVGTDGAAILKQIAGRPYVLPSPELFDPRVMMWDLGPGETSVITMALRLPEYRAVLDDRMARNCALSLGCSYTGSVGVLVLARRNGLIGSLRDGLLRLQAAGLWITDQFIEEILTRAGD